MAADDHQRVERSAALCTNLEQLTTLHGIVQERIDRMKAVTATLETAVTRVERERVEEGDALGALASASEDAVRRARLVGVKLEASFLEGRVDEAPYRAALAAAFPHGSQSVGSTPAQRLDALEHIVDALSDHAGLDPDGSLATLAREGAQAIREANERAKREQSEHQSANEALTTARHDFDEAYRATEEIVSGLLREARRLSELRDIVP